MRTVWFLIIFGVGLSISSTAYAPPICTKKNPCIVITFVPDNPVKLDTTQIGSIISKVVVTMKPSGVFRGTISFGSPYGDNNGMFAISGYDMILAKPFPSGSSVQHATLVAQ